MFTYDPKTHKVLFTSYSDRGEPRGLVMVFATKLKTSEIKPAIRNIVKEYLLTPEGRAVLNRNHGIFDYGDFIDCITPADAARHGLTPVISFPADISDDHAENLASDFDPECADIGLALAETFAPTPKPSPEHIAANIKDFLARQPSAELTDSDKTHLIPLAEFIDCVDSKCFIDYDGCGKLVLDDRHLMGSCTILSENAMQFDNGDEPVQTIPLRTLKKVFGDRAQVVWYNR